jgi:hypothetical protein
MRFGSHLAKGLKNPKMEPKKHKYCKFYLILLLLIADLYIYFRKGADGKMVLGVLKKALIRGPISRLLAKWESKHKAKSLKPPAGGVNMNGVEMLCGAEPRKILQTVIEEKTPAVMSYLSRGKWHVAKGPLTNLGANRLNIQLLPSKKPHPINIQVNQPVGISLKYGYGKFIFETKVIGLEPSQEATSGGTILLAVPDRIEIVQRRSYFRVEVPQSLKVNVMLWHRHPKDGNSKSEKEYLETPDKCRVSSDRYCQGKLVDISAGGAQIAVDAGQTQDFKKGQFIGLRFTPMPYETPVMFDAQIRNILPTADNKSICLGLQIVGLEASPEGRQVLQRLCNVVEQYYQINQSSAKQQDLQEPHLASSQPTSS